MENPAGIFEPEQVEGPAEATHPPQLGGEYEREDTQAQRVYSWMARLLLYCRYEGTTAGDRPVGQAQVASLCLGAVEAGKNPVAKAAGPWSPRLEGPPDCQQQARPLVYGRSPAQLHFKPGLLA